MQTSFDYQVLANAATPCIRNFRLSTAGLAVGCILTVGHLVYCSLSTPKNNTNTTLKAGIAALLVFATYQAFSFSCYYRNQINEIISKAVVAENGIFTPAKKLFIQTFGWHCTKLLGSEACYLTQQKELMKVIPYARFWNINLNVWQFVDPSMAFRG